ncbi:MAG: Hsp70 family protein [Deltaproteobacteria bacterium]|nr:Hsp70 family protein [Deltaproteobacteria bacterium]
MRNALLTHSLRSLTLLVLLCAGCKDNSRPPSLGEQLSVAQPGNVASQIFAQGIVLPTSATEAFTTSKDDEKHLYVHVVRGAGHQAEKLKTEGWWSIEGVGAGAAGTQKIMVTFELDAQGALTISARQEDKKLSVKKFEGATDKLKAARLLDPDDEDDLVEEQDEN